MHKKKAGEVPTVRSEQGCVGYNRMLWTGLRRKAAYLPG
jgi:hypothetical protein